MKRIRFYLYSFLNQEDGQLLLEYVLLISMAFQFINVCISPLKKNIMDLARDILIHAGLP